MAGGRETNSLHFFQCFIWIIVLEKVSHKKTPSCEIPKGFDKSDE